MSEAPNIGPSSAGSRDPVKPDKGELRAKLDQWIPWVKERIQADTDFPSVLDLARQAVNDSSGKKLLFAAIPEGVSLEILEDCWGNKLSEAAGDIGVRAAVLCCAIARLSLLQADLDELDDAKEDSYWFSDRIQREEIEGRCARAQQFLGLAVRFLPVEDCGTTWRDVQWEILNCYLIEDWDRATRLYNRAEDLELKSAGQIAALRGQFRFLTVFGGRIEENVRMLLKRSDIRLALNSLFWESRIYRPDDAHEVDETDQLKALLLFENGMCDGDQKAALSDLSKSTLLDCANDLQKALLALPDLPYVYRALLGRCQYCTGHFHDAAEEYFSLLQSRGQSGQPKPGRRLFASLVLSYKQAGETERAKQFLERWAVEYPDEKNVYQQLAELEAQGANYLGAVEYVRKEIDRNPGTDVDWRLSALLALGSTHETSKSADTLKRTALWQPVYTMLEDYWPAFSKLGEITRTEWVTGVVLNHLPDLPEKIRMRMAAEAHVKAMEIELRDRVFRQYKSHVGGHDSLREAAAQGLRDHRARKFCEFLVRDGTLSLGDMAWILRKIGSIHEPIFKDFQGWLSKSQRRLLQGLSHLERANDFRRPAAHEGLTKSNPAEVIRSCRTAIEALN